MLLLGAQAGPRHARWLPFIHLGEAGADVIRKQLGQL